MSTLKTTTRKCDRCCQLTPYEPVLFGHTDLAASLPHHCSDCSESAKKDEERERQKRIDEEREREIQRVLSPEMRSTDATHPKFNKKAWAALQRWTPSSGKWLVLQGETRLSKSRICALHTMHLIRQGIRVEWVTANAFQWAASREHDDDKNTRQQARHWLTTWKHAAALVFDDFGKAGFTPGMEKHLFDLVDHRFNYHLPTLISCNTPPENMIANKMLSPDRGAPIVTRILEAAGGAAITLTPPSTPQ